MRRLSAAAALAFLSTLALAGPQPIGQRELSGRDNRFIEIPAGHADAGFRAVAPGKRMAFDASGVQMQLKGPRLAKSAGGSAALRYAFEGGKRVAPEGVKPSATVYHWLVGDRAEWLTNLKSYGALAYRGVWPGVDAVFAGDAGGFKYQFELAAGVNPATVALVVEGADDVRVNEAGALEWRIGGETVVDDAPLAFQPAGGGHSTVAAAYRVESLGAGRWRVGFTVGAHDASKALIIDPAWTGYSGLVGGSAQDQVHAVARDGSGNTFACGVTRSSNLPRTTGSVFQGGDDAFFVKFDAAGVAQVVSFVGGSGDDICTGIALDASGRIYLAGGTASTNFPTAGTDATSRLRRTKAADRDAFVMRLAATGATVEYSGFIGGSETDQANAIAVDSSNRAYVTGLSSCTAIVSAGCVTATTAFPAFVGPRTTHGGSQLDSEGLDAFVARVDASGGTLEYAGFIGGRGSAEMGNAIVVGADFSAYVAGATDSETGLAMPGGFRTAINPRAADASDGFVAKVAPAGDSLAYFTLLTGTAPAAGESGADRAFAIALESDGTVIVAGETDSQNFPANDAGTRTGSGPQPTNGGGMDGFVLRLNAAGTAIDAATYLGGPGHDSAEAVTTDGTSLFVAGTTTNGTGFPTQLQSGLATTPRGGQDAFLAKIVRGSPGTFTYSGFIGTPATDTLRSLAASVAGGHTILSAGGTTTTPGTTNLVNPTTGAMGASSASSGLVVRIDPFGPPSAVIVQTGAGQSTPIFTAFPTTLSVLVRDVDNQVLAGVTVTFSAPGTGASATFSPAATATTDASGIATVSATANAFAGAYNVTATAATPTGSAFANIALTNLKGDQAITGFATIADRTMLQTPFGVSASATSTLAVEFSSTTGTVCTVAGTQVTLLAEGTCEIAADQPGNANYNPAPQVRRSFLVSRAAQSISFGPLADAQIELGGITVSATGGASGQPVTFSSLTAPVCTVSGDAVSFVSPGPCTIAADQAGNTVYAPAAQAPRTFQVLPDVTAPETALDTGISGLVNTASATFTYSSPDPSASFECSLDGAAFAACPLPTTYTGLADGPHTFAVRAKDPAGNADATPAGASWTVDTTPPVLAFVSKPVITAANEAAYSVAGTCSDDGRAIAVQISSILAAATCGTPASGQFATTAVDASGLAQGAVSLQASTTDAAGNPASISDSTTKDTIGPALTLGALDAVNNGNKASYGLAGTCEATGGAVGYTLTATASVNGSTPCAAGNYAAGGLDLTALADGTVAVSVTQADAAGNSSTANGSVSKDTAAPSIAIDAPATVNAATVASYAVTGTCSENGRDVSVVVSNGTVSAPGTGACGATTPGLYSVTVDLTTFLDGPVTILATHADAAGNPASANANAAKDTIVVPPVITGPAAGAAVAVNPAISGTGEAGAIVTVANGVTPVCMATVATAVWACPSALGGGAYTLTATQVDPAGNASAASAPVSFTVQGGQTIDFNPLAGRVFGETPFNVSATASSGLAVQFSSTTTAVCTVSGTLVTLLAAGTCEIAADQPGDATNAPAPQVRQSFNVAKAAQSIAFGPLSGRTFGDPSFTVSATGGASGIAIVFTSLTGGTCSVTGNSVSILGAGPCQIAADQAGNTNYEAAPRVTQSFQVATAAQAIAFGPLANRTFGEPDFAVSATGGASGNPVLFASLSGGTCSVTGNSVSLLAAGTCQVAADQAGSANYSAAPRVTQSFTIARGAQAISFAALAHRTMADPAFTVAATASSGLAVSFGSATPAVCTVAGTTVTPVAPGVCTITADQAGDANRAPAPQVGQSFYLLAANPAADSDGDGIPDPVEVAHGRHPFVMDNDVFASGTGGAGLFVMQQYRDFLGREGDPAGVQAWVDDLTAGTHTRAQVIDGFLTSPEFGGFVAPIVRLYFAALGRVPDYAGLTFNAGLVRAGTITIAQLAEFFAASPEFLATYGALDNAAFVSLLYQNVLGRAPDPLGLVGWVSALDAGAYSRGAVLLGFSDSFEYQATSANRVLVSMMYTGMLRRTPDTAGFDGWVSLRDGGMARTQVIDGFFLSTEYHGRFLP